MKRIHMVTAGALVFVFAGCIVGSGGGEKVGEGFEALMCETCSSGAGAGTGSSGHTGVTSSHSSSTTSSTTSTSGSLPPQPITGLPQGLTGGLAYFYGVCEFSANVMWPPTGGFWSECTSPYGSPCVQSILDFTNSGCEILTVGLNATVAGAQTLTMTWNGQHVTSTYSTNTTLTIAGASGWAVGSDGDRGLMGSSGFYHQELSSVAGGITAPSKSTLFELPPGTACGFHHTQSSPPQGEMGTCMGYDAGARTCPQGWLPKHHFDMSSGDGSVDCGSPSTDLRNQHCGYFVWCEYQDPNNFCPAGSACAQAASAAGYAVAIASDVDPNGYSTDYGTSCPAGLTRSAWYDDGRSAGQGVGTCTP